MNLLNDNRAHLALHVFTAMLASREGIEYIDHEEGSDYNRVREDVQKLAIASFSIADVFLQVRDDLNEEESD